MDIRDRDHCADQMKRETLQDSRRQGSIGPEEMFGKRKRWRWLQSTFHGYQHFVFEAGSKKQPLSSMARASSISRRTWSIHRKMNQLHVSCDKPGRGRSHDQFHIRIDGSSSESRSVDGIFSLEFAIARLEDASGRGLWTARRLLDTHISSA